MANREQKPEDNDTPPETLPAHAHASRADLYAFRKEVMHSIQRIADSIENNRHEVGITLSGIKDEISDGITKQAVIENRLTMVERIVYGLCAVVGVAVVGAILALVIVTKGPQP